MRLSEDGTRVAAATEPDDRGLLVYHWDADTGKPRTRFIVELIPSCAITDQVGGRLILGGHNILGVWSLESGVCVHEFTNFKGTVLGLAASPDNTRLMASMSDRQIQIFAMSIS